MARPDVCYPCEECELIPFAVGADWGYLNGPRWSDYCLHVVAMRYCASCSANWWQVGLDGAWDVDGCAHKDCPRCVEADAAEAAGTACASCHFATPEDDRLPFGAGVAHAACAMSKQLEVSHAR